jgi:hypothetical protein
MEMVAATRRIQVSFMMWCDFCIWEYKWKSVDDKFMAVWRLTNKYLQTVKNGRWPKRKDLGTQMNCPLPHRISGQWNHMLAERGNGIAMTIMTPLHCLTTNERWGLVVWQWELFVIRIAERVKDSPRLRLSGAHCTAHCHFCTA